jgi:putative transposase
MAQPPHYDLDGSIYFVTTRLNEGRKFAEHETEIVEKTISELAAQKEMTLYAYVIMPNHVHILMSPLVNGISKTMQLLKGRSSRRINEGAFWQKGFFDFSVISEEKFREKFNYIHHNPVKRGLVERAEDYKHSSAKDYKVRYGEVFYE